MTEPLHLPAIDADWATWLDDRVGADLAAAEGLLGKLKEGGSRDTRTVLDLWNDTDIALSNAQAVAGLLAQVHPDEAVRTRAEQHSQQVSRAVTARELDREIFDAVVACAAADDEEAERLRVRILRDFRRSGVECSEAERTRLREIAERLVIVEQDLGRTIRNDVRSIRLRPEQLDGLPPDFIDAHPAGEDGLVAITTNSPDVVPFITFAHDADARREVVFEFLNLGWPDNDAVLHELFELRAERAQLLGYADWPDYDAEVKMIGSGTSILEFVDEVSAAADQRGHDDMATLRARQLRDDPQSSGITRADSRYYEELVRREDYDVDSQEARRYFDFERVRAGLLDTTSVLFGIEYRSRPDASVWHEDVAAYDVVREGTVIGRIYLDLHPRDGKFKHAAQFDLVSGVTGRQLPEGALVCNLPRGLMEHTNVVTLFHEFGHLVHHILAGQQRWIRFSGVATEWDFVEAPSMMLEEWAWDPSVLESFARAADGTSIPRELVERMRAAHELGKGYFVRSQIAYAALSYLLHRDRPDDLTAVVRSTQEKYDVIDYLEGTHFHAAFGHLAGYGSGYYTYMWSLVIAKDLFSAFDPDNLLDPSVAHRYRDLVLAPGGSRDAAQLVESFLGRPYSFTAFRQWLDR